MLHLLSVFKRYRMLRFSMLHFLQHLLIIVKCNKILCVLKYDLSLFCHFVYVFWKKYINFAPKKDVQVSFYICNNLLYGINNIIL